MICLSCNKDVNELSSKGLCRACYNYFKDGGTVNPLPDAGTIAYDERGYVDDEGNISYKEKNNRPYHNLSPFFFLIGYFYIFLNKIMIRVKLL